MSRQSFLTKHHSTISRLYNGIRTIYGPYLGKDNRYRVVLYDGQRRITRQYSKLKMEILLGRRLSPNETVDHDDGNTRNDKRSNLVVRARREHVRLDIKRIKLGKQADCKWCGKSFVLRRFQFNVRGGAGPFCSKRCTGKYGAHVQNGGGKIKRQVHKTEYHNLKGRRFSCY